MMFRIFCKDSTLSKTMQTIFCNFAPLKRTNRMNDMEHIIGMLSPEMEALEAALAETLSSATAPMDTVLHYVAAVRGKRLRPALVFLSARLFGEINDDTRRTALFVELLHTATLIHDDVVDGADERRGRASVNARWDNLTAVLAGDFLLSKAVSLLMTSPDDHRILREMMDAALAMSEGELLQSSLTTVSAETYLEIIRCKTAKLIRSCCVGGALSVHATHEQVALLADFGLNLGLVFQLRDDLLDADHPDTVTLAERLLPTYLDKALTALDALAPMAKDPSAWTAFRELTQFCADRRS